MQPLPTRDIFLSHRSNDKPFVRQLAADIEAQVPGKSSLLAWFDEAEIRPGQSIPGMIDQGLQMSHFVGIVMTPAYFTSPSGWTDAEWHAALHSDPDNRRARIIPLLAVDCPTIPPLLRHLDFIDLRGEEYAIGLQRLLRVLRNEPLPRPVVHRGLMVTPTGSIDPASLMAARAIPDAAPDVISERAYCNLLPVEQLPRTVFVAPIAQRLCTLRRDGTFAMPTKEILKGAIRQAQQEQGIERPFMPAFRVFEDKIVTFHDLAAEESVLSAIVEPDAEVETYRTQEVLQDEDSRLLVIALLNMGLSRHASRAGLVFDETKQGRYFFPPKDGREQVITWRPRKMGRVFPRTVAKPCVDKDGRTLFWRHLGAYLKIMYLATRLYVFIRPTWVLTSDGVQVKTGPDVGRWVIKWTGAERNLQILFHVRFWTTILSGGRSTLVVRVGDQSMEIATVPAMIQLPYGVADDQRDLMQQLAEEAELLAQEEDDLMEAVVATQTTSEESSHDDEMEDVLEEEAFDAE